MNSASLCSMAGRYTNPNPTRFLAPIDCLKIPALYCTLSLCQSREYRVISQHGRAGGFLPVNSSLSHLSLRSWPRIRIVLRREPKPRTWLYFWLVYYIIPYLIWQIESKGIFFFRYLSRSLLRKGVGGVTPPPHLSTNLLPISSVDISVFDDVTVIILLSVSFMINVNRDPLSKTYSNCKL